MNQATRLGLAIGLIPVEIIRRVIGWNYTVRGTYTHHCPYTGRTLTVKDRMRYDSFTYAPNLRRADGGPSRAAQVHDVGWVTGKWDDGTPLTFEECNEAFLLILIEEKHPARVVDWYYDGVSLPFMRRKWQKLHGHA